MTGAPGRTTPGLEDTRGASVSESLRSRAPVIQWGEVALASRSASVRRRPGANIGGYWQLPYMTAAHAPSHQAGEQCLLGVCGPSGLCSRSGRGTHSRGPAAGSAVFALGCARDRRRTRRNRAVAPQNSRALKLIDQFSWVRALAKYHPTTRSRSWRPGAREKSGRRRTPRCRRAGSRVAFPLRGLPTDPPQRASPAAHERGAHEKTGYCAESKAVWRPAANASPRGTRPTRSIARELTARPGTFPQRHGRSSAPRALPAAARFRRARHGPAVLRISRVRVDARATCARPALVPTIALAG